MSAIGLDQNVYFRPKADVGSICLPTPIALDLVSDIVPWVTRGAATGGAAWFGVFWQWVGAWRACSSWLWL